MKKSVLPLMLTLVVLCGCAHQYVLKLSNGMQVTSSGKPRLKGGYYYYKDAQGRRIPVPQGRVIQIEPASMAAEEKKFTVPSPTPKRHWWQFWRSS